MEPQDFLPFIPWIVGGVFLISLAAILGWVHNTRLRIKHGYPLASTAKRRSGSSF